ncbi:hypothetical protein DFJ73DRAFT_262372 [Zopfochytrium polystomum]|nr:hypothetical protein DFJ73DRAFT_262372 [Zopfochytrium polystomum]
MPSSTAAPAPSSMQQPPPFTGAPNLASGLLAMVHTEHDNDTTLDPAEGARLLAAAAAAATATSPSLQSLPAPSTARHTPVASSMHSSATTPASPVLASSPDAKPAAPPHRPDSPTSLHTATHPDPDPVPSDSGDATPADLKVAISDVTDERKSEAGSPIEDAEEDGMPDGGAHAWLVVLASFVVQFWVFGVLYSFGVYNVSGLDDE